MAIFSLSSRMVFLLCIHIPGVSVYVLISSPYKDTSLIGFGVTHVASFNLNYLYYRLYLQTEPHFKVLGVRASTYKFKILSIFYYAITFVSFFLPFNVLYPAPHSLQYPPHSSCPWVIHVSSLASPFPILFLTSPCQFCTYHLCFLYFLYLFPLFLFCPSPLITLHVISISVILFMF